MEDNVIGFKKKELKESSYYKVTKLLTAVLDKTLSKHMEYDLILPTSDIMLTGGEGNLTLGNYILNTMVDKLRVVIPLIPEQQPETLSRFDGLYSGLITAIEKGLSGVYPIFIKTKDSFVQLRVLVINKEVFFLNIYINEVSVIDDALKDFITLFDVPVAEAFPNDG